MIGTRQIIWFGNVTNSLRLQAQKVYCVRNIKISLRAQVHKVHGFRIDTLKQVGKNTMITVYEKHCQICSQKKKSVKFKN